MKSPSQPLGKKVVTAEINFVFIDSSRKELKDQPSVDLSRNKLMGSTIL
jgi:hypothetical protein